MMVVVCCVEIFVVVYFDYVEWFELVDDVVVLGFGLVMFDGGVFFYDENVVLMVVVVECVYVVGVYVEGEFGEVGGKDGVYVFGVCMDFDEVWQFVVVIGVDVLVVVVGFLYVMIDCMVFLDFDLIWWLYQILFVLFVLYGFFGVVDEVIVDVVWVGMMKINVFMYLNGFFICVVCEKLVVDEGLVDLCKYFVFVCEVFVQEVVCLF